MTADALQTNYLEGGELTQKKLVEEFYPALILFIKKFVPTNEDAEEIGQDCFCKIFTKRLSFESREKFRGYLYETARTTIIDFHRKNKRRLSASSHIDVELVEGNLSDEDIAAEVIADEWFSVFRKEIAKQRKKRRRILTQFYIDEMKIRDIANLENISEWTVHDHIRAFRLHMIKKYGNWPFDSPPTL